MAMDQYLYIPFLGGWTSIYQLFWYSLQGYKVLTHCHISISRAEHSGISSSSTWHSPAMARRLSQTPARLNRYESPCWWLSKKWGGMIADFEMFSSWWFGTWFLFSISYMGCHPKPIDELIFFRGVGLKPPTSLNVDYELTHSFF